MEETPSDWLCKVCEKSDNKGKFCSRCGTPQGAWNCLTCGQEGNTGKFCPKCGTPEGTWSCSACGTSGNTGRFCPKCGAGRPEPRTIEGLEHEAEPPESSMGPAAMGDAISAAPEGTDFTAPTARETSNTAATTGDTPPSAPMSKRTKLILALIAFVAVAYWSFGIVTEKLYEAKEKEFLTIMTDSRTLFASLDALSGDAAAEETKTAGDGMEEMAERLGKLREEVAGKTPPEKWKDRHEKFLAALEKNQTLFVKSAALLQSTEYVFDTETRDKFTALQRDFSAAWAAANTASAGLDIGGQEVAGVFSYPAAKEQMRSYVQKKLAFDERYVIEKRQEYRERHQAEQRALIEKKEVVFLIGSVWKEGQDLLLQGQFYNGTSDVVTSIKDMLLDVTLLRFDREIESFTDFLQEENITNMNLRPGQFSFTVTLRLVEKAPAEDFNNYTVNAHKIRWGVKRAVQR